MLERLTILESQDRLKEVYNIVIHYETLKRWCNTGKLPARKIGTLWLINKAKLDDFAREFKGHDKGGRPRLNGDRRLL